MLALVLGFGSWKKEEVFSRKSLLYREAAATIHYTRNLEFLTIFRKRYLKFKFEFKA